MKSEQNLKKVVPLNTNSGGGISLCHSGLPQIRRANLVDRRVRNDGNDSVRSVPINVTAGGCAFALKYSYSKNISISTVTRGGGHFPCTAILEVYESEGEHHSET